MRREARKEDETRPGLDDHQGNMTDPTGHVSSGLQPGPLHGGDERPVAAPDEAMRQPRDAGSPGRARDAKPATDILEPYRVKEDNDEV